MKTAEELGLPPEVRDAFEKILLGMEQGRYVHVPMYRPAPNEGVRPFNMGTWGGNEGADDESAKDCGTAACLGGWAEREVPGFDVLRWCFRHAGEANMPFHELELWKLCMAEGFVKDTPPFGLSSIGTDLAAKALRRYLETGRGDWEGL
jgi:hypothetical protein